MRLLIAEGRHLEDVTLIRRALKRACPMGPVAVIIHGGNGVSSACQSCLRCCRDALATARGWDPPRAP